MKREILFLKAVVILMGIPVLGLCVFWLPGMAGYFFSKLLPGLAYLHYPFLIGLYAAATAFFFALYQAFILLRCIDRHKAFSASSAKALKNIQYCAIAIGILYAAGLPLLYVIADADDAPGLIVIGLFISFASMVIAAFASVLQKLVTNAVDTRSGN